MKMLELYKSTIKSSECFFFFFKKKKISERIKYFSFLILVHFSRIMILKFFKLFFHVLSVICSFTFSFLLYEYKIVFVLSVYFYRFFVVVFVFGFSLPTFKFSNALLKMRWKIQSHCFIRSLMKPTLFLFLFFRCSLIQTVCERKGSYTNIPFLLFDIEDAVDFIIYMHLNVKQSW